MMMPSRHLFAGLGAARGFLFVERLRFGAEIDLRQSLKLARRRLRAFVFPAVGQLFDVSGERAVQIVRRVVFADVDDRSIQRHQFFPSITRTSCVVGSASVSK